MFVAQPPTAQQQQQAPQQKPATKAQEEQAAAAELEAEFAEALAALEQHIYQKEGEYLEKTPHGNVARGWEGFLDTRGMTAKRRFDDRDRLFSYSSYTFTETHPNLFHDRNTKDDDPDNWVLALRKRHDVSSGGGGGVPGGYGAVVASSSEAASSSAAGGGAQQPQQHHQQPKATTGRKTKRQKAPTSAPS